MKLNAAREALLKPLQAVIGVVERRQTMPILANVLLVAKNGRLSVTGTDLEVELVATADELNVHYNTLRYRLGQIERLTGGVERHPMSRLQLEIAVHANRLACGEKITQRAREMKASQTCPCPSIRHGGT